MSMQSPASRSRAFTTPIVQGTSPADLVRSPTNTTGPTSRDRHAVPPSILAQNRELLGITERPRALTCSVEQHTSGELINTGSSGGGHIEYSEGVISTISIPAPRRRSTLTILSDTARKTGRNAKRRLSKVITWTRRDSGNEEGTRSPPKKVHRMDDVRTGSQDVESQAPLLSDGQADPGTPLDEDVVDFSTYPFVNPQATPRYVPPCPLQLDPSALQHTSADPRDWQATPQTLMRLSVEYHNKHSSASPDLFPHESFAEDRELWDEPRRRLELLARRPELVGERFEQIYRELS